LQAVALDLEPVLGREQGGFVEAYIGLCPFLAEHAVEGEQSGKGSGLAAVPSPENRA